MKKILIVAASCILVIGMVFLIVVTKPFVIGLYHEIMDAFETGESESSSTVSSESTETSSGKEEELTPPLLTPIEVAQPNNIGYTGYMEKTLVSGEKRYSVYKQVLDSYNLVPYIGDDGKTVVLDTGHQVYRKSNSEDNQLYIVSGVELLPVNDGWVIDTSMSVKLRAEGSGERIRIYTNEGEYNMARENYEKGQAILNGEEKVPDNCVILNGMYLPSVHYEVHEDGKTYLPMTQIAEAYDEQSEFYSVEGWLNVAVDLKYIIIPTNLTTQSVKEFFSVEENTWKYSNEGYPMWSDSFYLPQTAQTEMPLEDIARIFGFQISVGENIVSIVTNELDNNDNFVLHKVNSTTTYYSLDELPSVSESDSSSQETENLITSTSSSDIKSADEAQETR